MLEDGYDLVGYSSFNAANVGERGALNQAKKVHAVGCYTLFFEKSLIKI